MHSDGGYTWKWFLYFLSSVCSVATLETLLAHKKTLYPVDDDDGGGQL